MPCLWTASRAARRPWRQSSAWGVGITLKEHNANVNCVDCVFTATASKKPYAKPGAAADAAEKGKVQYYERTYAQCPAGPRAKVVGFAQETGGPLGAGAKQLIRLLAEP